MTKLKFFGVITLVVVAIAGYNFMRASASKVLSPDNIIHNYEWFHDVYQTRQSRINQIIQYKGFYAAEEDPKEKNRLRVDMTAMQTSCRDLTSKYNANSQKVHVSIFKGGSLPDMLNLSECEVQ
jgi:hypothetical protein